MNYYIELVFVRLSTGSILRLKTVHKFPYFAFVEDFDGFRCIEQNTTIVGPAA